MTSLEEGQEGGQTVSERIEGQDDASSKAPTSQRVL